jgi:tetratricopeptide (TPR) repeat protein
VSDDIYERYKDALRRGHVAALRGRLEVAAAAYDEASRIAPERALPHSSLGDVLGRLGRFDEALTAFGAALDRVPRDETALAARSEVLATLGRRTEAAADLDTLAEFLDASDRLAEACDTARRALELAESKSRRRFVEGLARRLRDSAPQDAVAAAALDRALTVLDARGAPARPGHPMTTLQQPSAVAEGRSGGVVEPEPEPEPDPDPEPEPEPLTEPESLPELDRGAELTGEAEELVGAGNRELALERSLAAMASHRTAGRWSAAIDACYLALAVAPDAPDLHLALAELYLEQGWRELASEKLLLLGRLVGLDPDGDGDGAGRERLCRLVRARFADDPRLMELCA